RRIDREERPTTEASFDAMRERSRFGMAMAAMIKMIATTISSSINEVVADADFGDTQSLHRLIRRIPVRDASVLLILKFVARRAKTLSSAVIPACICFPAFGCGSAAL